MTRFCVAVLTLVGVLLPGKLTAGGPRVQKPPQKVPASSGQWTLIGPRPTVHPAFQLTSGRVLGLAVDPRNAGVVYAATGGGGVWKTADGGLNWTPLTDNQPSLVIGAIALDPAHPDTVYAGTGQGLNVPTDHYGVGILKSTDGGATWTSLPGPSGAALNAVGQGAKFTAIAAHPTDGKTVLAAVIPGVAGSPAIYRSTDGGVSWTGIPSLAGSANSVLFDPSNGNTAYAALQTKGVYKSTDGGVTWSPSNGSNAGNTLPSLGFLTVQLAIAPSSPATLYAGFAASDSTFLALYKTADGGQNWAAVPGAPNYCRNQCEFNNTIAVHPGNSNVVYLGGQEVIGPGGEGHIVFRSTDAGGTWSDISSDASGNLVHVDVHAIAFAADGSRVYVGNDGGVWSSADVSVSPVRWANLNVTLAITQFHPGHSIHPSDVNFMWAGTQDNGAQLFTGGLAWLTEVCGDAYAAAIDPVNPSTVYVLCNQGAINKSTNGGPFRSANSGVDPTERRDQTPPFALDPSNPSRLYYGTVRVYQSTDGAGSWTAISPVLPSGGVAFISTIAVAASNPNVVYAGLSGGRMKLSANALSGAAATWSDISTGLPGRWINQVVVDPGSAATAYAVLQGFTGVTDSAGHIFQTTNSGASWADISGNLPNIPVNELVIDPDIPGTLYAGTDRGVYATADGGGTWAPLGSGLPNAVVRGLKLHRPTRTLRASTFGRSMWDLLVPVPSQPALPQIAAGGAVNAASFAPGVVVPGSLASVFGVNLASSAVGASGLPLPTSLGGVGLRFGTGTAVPLVFASPGQVNIQVPWELKGMTQAQLAATINGITYNSTPVNLAAYGPGIFTTASDGSGQAAIQISNTAIFAAPSGSITGAQARPASRGEFVTIYCTGLGDVSNRPATGAAAPSSPLAATIGTATVTIGGVNAPVNFSGLTPGFVGLYQVNAQVPATAPTGDAVAVSVSIGGVASNTATMAVQ